MLRPDEMVAKRKLAVRFKRRLENVGAADSPPLGSVVTKLDFKC
jgi:hypothetical protein